MKTILSKGNTKLGDIWNVSLDHSTCRKDAPCFKQCYNNKASCKYKEVREAYQHNTVLYKSDPDKYMVSILQQLAQKRRSKHFRWHISGDIPNKYYYFDMMEIAHHKRDWHFLCFTKRYSLVSNTAPLPPPNLKIIFSAWEHFPLKNPRNFPVAYHLDESNPDERIPDNATICKKKCDQCFHCWNMSPGDSIVLPHH